MGEINRLELFELCSQPHGAAVDIGSKLAMLCGVQAQGGVVLGCRVSVSHQQREAEFVDGGVEGGCHLGHVYPVVQASSERQGLFVW